jgi:ribosomal protein L18
MNGKSREVTRQRRKCILEKSLWAQRKEPRVFLFRSNKYIYLGLADDEKGKVNFSLKGGKNSRVKLLNWRKILRRS